MSNETRTKCSSEFLLDGNGEPPSNDQHVPGMLYYGYVTPFVNMSIAGFVWCTRRLIPSLSVCSESLGFCNADQGENNCETAYVGNVLNGSGYGCELPAMVADWRSVWSATPGTTAPLAPFGIVTLAAGGSEGHSGAMAAMRWSQTANYGHFDNPALPATFGAQLYDLGDPWAHSGTGDGNTLQVRSFVSVLLLWLAVATLQDESTLG